jgi:hypothetical protein
MVEGAVDGGGRGGWWRTRWMVEDAELWRTRSCGGRGDVEDAGMVERTRGGGDCGDWGSVEIMIEISLLLTLCTRRVKHTHNFKSCFRNRASSFSSPCRENPGNSIHRKQE